MSGGSGFVAALMAVVLFKMMTHAPNDTPVWYDLVAALGGTVIAWGMARVGVALKQRRLSR